MRRAALFLITAATVCAQANRDAYRKLYQDWRQVAPALEQEAAVAGPNFANQVQASAQAAKAYLAEREKFFATSGPVGAGQVTWLRQPLPRGQAILETPQEIQQLVAVMAARVATNIGSFAGDKDPAIRQVRQAMERERAALRALVDSMNSRKTLLTELNEAQDVADQQRAAVSDTVQAIAARGDALVSSVQREAAAWDEYYKGLGESVSAPARPGPSASVQPAPTPAAPGAMPVSRYTGEWIFPNRGLFYGPQPESVTLTVQEDGGQLKGTVDARFMDNTSLNLEFQGPIQGSRNQTFALQSAAGVQGTIELIPGSAFNLIEVNLQTNAKPASANFILVLR